jgi:hypothetical protein
MATHDWIFAAVPIKQVGTGVVANTWATGDTVTLTIANLDFVITIGSLVTTAEVATTVKQAFNGETLTDTTATCTIPVADGGAQAIPVFSEFVATVSSSTVTFTARNTYGKPITMTGTESTAGTGTFTYTNAVTAAKGPHEADNADNFSGNAALLDNDTLNFAYGADEDSDMLYDLSLAVQLATINKAMVHEGSVGNAKVNDDTPSKPYTEYRTLYMTTDDNTVTTTANLETGQGKGSGRFMWDAGAGQVVLNIFGRGTRKDNAVPCILFKGSHASNVVNNMAGDLGIAFFNGETAVVATLRNGDGPQSNAETFCGSGVTLSSGTITHNGGKLTTNSAISAYNQYGGQGYHYTGTVTAATIYGGEHFPMGGATYTTLTLGPNGTFDTRKAVATFTITNTIQLHKGAKFIDPTGRAGNVVFKLNRCSPADVTIVLPPDKTYTLS